MSALTDDLKSRIQEAYRAWLEARGFRARRGQREMIAHIARTCVGEPPRLAAIEAGTGTGKTVAYCLAAIPIAQALEKTLVIASATVALQEQIVERDLPDLAEGSGLDFNFVLAKGRGRYLCVKRLDQILNGGKQQELGLSDASVIDHSLVWRQMMRDFGDGSWNGELDTWEAGVEDVAWRSVTTDHRGCANRKCGFYAQCPFFKARHALGDADVIVANHDLLLADYAFGGGVVLPAPESSILVIDEAHHLPDKTQRHFALSARLAATAVWGDQVNALAGTLAQRMGRPAVLERMAKGLVAECDALKAGMETLGVVAAQLPFAERFRDGDSPTEVCRFPHGQVDPGLVEAAGLAAAPLARINAALVEMQELLRKAMDGGLDWPNPIEAEDWLAPVGQAEARAAAVRALLEDYAQASDGAAAQGRMARWASRSEQDLELVSAPIEPGQLLGEHLWSRCHAAVATSATLTALGRFDRFFERAGLEEARGVSISSPFDYPSIAVLSVPQMDADPKDVAGHTAEVAGLLPELLTLEPSALVLFTSWRQMNQVRDALTGHAVMDAAQFQGERSKQAMLKRHLRRVDGGEPSYLMGLASFAEGVDLPGDYCRHVIVVKLPFAVPDDPVDQAIAELAQSQGRNPFMEITVPDAALKLVQACGRLIRDDSDHGRITLLDKRVLTKRYGRALLDSLPPFRREFGGSAALSQVRSSINSP
ncbi:MAG: ATP-dependent DNA helicase DinG [Gammaproteobacteria bacterium]|nr:ATP-dependent DNA helicase DinG [Gammaproteobacteria bacterium]MYG14049.1 ATP-dependent DNA helicase DinG [Gammaproteobacteria bacterium]MYK28198.1 ATP-dependent DNA helicase DinG [Gammaproteobacteria bacterium]